MTEELGRQIMVAFDKLADSESWQAANPDGWFCPEATNVDMLTRDFIVCVPVLIVAHVHLGVLIDAHFNKEVSC